jgi:HNH endonuclease
VQYYQENSEYKEEYLKNYEGETQNLFRKILFNYCIREERKNKKDLHQFNLRELELLNHSFKFKSLPTARSYNQTINSYLNFCVNKGYIGINPLESVFSTAWLKKFVSTENYLTDDDIHVIIDKCVNPQDAVLIQLLFEGVGGTNKNELINLKREDVNVQNNILTLTDKNNSTRLLVVSDRCIELILKAHEQSIYKTKNGVGKKRAEESIELSEYIIKKVGIGLHTGKQTPTLVSNRLTTIADDLKINLNPKLIVNSGKLSLVKNIYKKYNMYNRQIKKEALDKLTERFNVSRQNNNGYFTPAHSLYKFISLELVNTIYELNIEEESTAAADFRLVDHLESDEGALSEEATVRRRLKQSDFRDKMLQIYSNKCCITGENLSVLLEAAHIQPYKNENSHHPQNGLLLRADIHKLFDKGLLTIDTEYFIKIDDIVVSPYYRSLHNNKINLPSNKKYYPSILAIVDRMNKLNG